MRKFRVHCNSIATRERFERALEAQGFRTFSYKEEFDKRKLMRIKPDVDMYYAIWEDNTYTLGSLPKDLMHIMDDIDYINGRQVISKAKWLRQQVDKLKEEQQ